MRIYTVHKKRVLAVATATATLVFLVAIAFINQEPRFRVSLDYDGSERDTEVDDANTSLPVGKNVVTVSDSRKPPERDAVGDLPPPTDEEEEDEDGESQDDPDTAAAAAWEPETVDDTGSYELEDDEEDDDENSNGVFREGDFDVMPPEINSTTSDNPDDDRSNTSVTMNDVRWYERVVDRKLQAEPPLRSWKVESNTKRHLKHPNGMDVIEDGIYWSKDLERLVPRGFTQNEFRHIQARLRQLPLAIIEPPSWNRCGRPKNQYLTFSDGSHACARYRAPHNYLVQGEVMSFYLGRLLGLDNIPIVVLSKVNPSSEQWKKTLPSVMKAAGWEKNETVALIQWIEGLERDKMPKIILEALESRRPVLGETTEISSLSVVQLVELVQWSDLIIFDYITGNYDRVASMQDAADKESKPDILKDTIHNLVKSRHTGGLWLIDNESGLLDAYSLLYAKNHPSQGHRFLDFHRQMLHTMCIFRRKTIERLRHLRNHSSVHNLLLNTIFDEEPLFFELHKSISNTDFDIHFRKRIEEVYRWILRCSKNAGHPI